MSKKKLLYLATFVLYTKFAENEPDEFLDIHIVPSTTNFDKFKNYIIEYVTDGIAYKEDKIKNQLNHFLNNIEEVAPYLTQAVPQRLLLEGNYKDIIITEGQKKANIYPTAIELQVKIIGGEDV